MQTTQSRLRFITAASLFDGHDASINIMRRILQSSGVEVVHLGHNRSVAEIVTAALQEDAQAIAISSYQGGHVEFFKYIVDELKRQNAPHIRLFGGGGGTITTKEAEELHRYGVSRIYSPEDGRLLGLQGIIDDMIKRAKECPFPSIDWKQIEKSPQASHSLGMALTAIENKIAFETVLKKSTRPSIVVGLTGTGGAGKSSLTDELVLRVLENEPNSRVALLAIDPTRRKTGGALLGDRIRINSAHHPRCFMRSLATRDSGVSVSQATQDAIAFLKQADFDWLFVETSGIGQSETPIVDWVDFNLYVMTSEFGAPTQLEKINMLDFADVVVLNKFDKAGALDAIQDVRTQLRRNHRQLEALSPTLYPVIGTVASRFQDPGVTMVYQHLCHLKSAGKGIKPL